MAGLSASKRYCIRHTVMSVAFHGAVVGGLYAAQDMLVYPGAYVAPPPGYDYTGMEETLSGRMLPGPSGEFFRSTLRLRRASRS